MFSRKAADRKYRGGDRREFCVNKSNLGTSEGIYTKNSAVSAERRGYACEALSALLRYLLYDLNLNMVIVGAFPDNAPSLGLIKKLGFQYEGLKHKAFWNELRGPMDLEYYYLEREAGTD